MHAVPAPAGAGLAPASRAVRAVVVVSVLAGLGAYAGPKLVALNGVPGRIGRSTSTAGRYNASLEQVAALDVTTLANLAALDRARSSLTAVLASLAGVDGRLSSTVARVRVDLAGALDPSAPAVARLAASVGDLEAATRTLGAPMAGSAAQIAAARAELTTILERTTATAGDLRLARDALATTAANVAGSG